jgi:hypothetical protein
MHLASGADAINARLRSLNAQQRRGAARIGDNGGTHVSGVEDVVLPEEVPQLVLKVPFPVELTGPSGVGAFDLYDTPGPNEAAEGVRELVTQNAKRILANADVVILVLDFTQMGTTQELELLECVSCIGPTPGKPWCLLMCRH